jgi:hypothetical protein
MLREQLEHIIRASSGITGIKEVIIIGSQAVLGQFPNAPGELLVSMEADVFSLRDPADSELIDGSIGEGSPFHKTFGYYAHGVGMESAVLPEDWKSRLIAIKNINTGGCSGLCLEVHDLAVSKLIAGREKDMDFIHNLLKNRLAFPNVIHQRLAITNVAPGLRELCEARLRRLEIQ